MTNELFEAALVISIWVTTLKQNDYEPICQTQNIIVNALHNNKNIDIGDYM